MVRYSRVLGSLCMLIMWCGCEGELSQNGEGGGAHLDMRTSSDGMDVRRDDQGMPLTDMHMETDLDPGTMADASMEMGNEEEEVLPPTRTPQREFFTCADPSAPRSSPARLARLGQREWILAASYGGDYGIDEAPWMGYLRPSDGDDIPAVGEASWYEIPKTGSLEKGGSEFGPTRTWEPGKRDQIVRADLPTHRYSSYVEGETLETPVVEFAFNLYDVGAPWRAGMTGTTLHQQWMRDGQSAESLRCFVERNTDRPSDECVRDYVVALLEHGVLHRTPVDREIDNLHEFALARLDEEPFPYASKNDSAGPRARTIEQIAQAARLMVGAQFRDESGSVEVGDGRRRLSDEEFGQVLSLALTETSYLQPVRGYRTSPDDPGEEWRLSLIKEAVEQGTITNPDKVEQIVRAYIGGKLDAGVDPRFMSHEVLHPPGSRYPGYKYTMFSNGARDLFSNWDSAREHWMSPSLQQFFREWLGYADAAAVFKEAERATTQYENFRFDGDGGRQRRAYEQARFPYELDALIARELFDDERSDRGDLADLLTSQTILLRTFDPDGTEDEVQSISRSEQRARNWVYGVGSPDRSVPILGGDSIVKNTPESRWREAPAGTRSGVFTHPAWLIAHGANFEQDASAIYRGKWVFENLLCGWIDELPTGVEAQLSEESRVLSARARIAMFTEQTGCQECHAAMNPFGYPFETYNHAGFLREYDHATPEGGLAAWLAMPEDERPDIGRSAPDGSSTLVFNMETQNFYKPGHPGAFLALTDGESTLYDGMQVDDATEMMEAFASSRHVKQCFIRHTFRYWTRRNETRADACTLADMEQAYDKNGSIVEMLVALFTSDTFLYRHDPEQGE